MSDDLFEEVVEALLPVVRRGDDHPTPRLGLLEVPHDLLEHGVAG